MKVALRQDEALEAQINVAYNRMTASGTDTERRKYWRDMTALIAQRSPGMVREMERRRGLDRRATFVPRMEVR